jgi:hypothetical protein
MKQKRHKPEKDIRLLRECDGSGMSQARRLRRWEKKSLEETLGLD